ncbi:hypothetical protein IG193_09115 [Infirmifilum lucidum]|uniref:Uncharacterized protein n=1 Tax=Infirmifilum lucidum TaxID=2776706 RepID=A0A7L9FGP7_9CREN|nr:hypothetical protein [Infirmifilum lucidum]QOJ78887.1 hypothetical protein IG193_09115 [Infirmifilum lucidum]
MGQQQKGKIKTSASCARRKKVESLKKFQQSTEEELEKLTPAILDKAFKGEL